MMFVLILNKYYLKVKSIINGSRIRRVILLLLIFISRRHVYIKSPYFMYIYVLHNISSQLLLQKTFFIQFLLYMKSNLPFGNAREKMYPFFLPNLQVGGDDLFLYIFLNGMPPRAKKRIMMDCSQHLNSITNEM